MHPLSTWQFAIQALEQNEIVKLLYVVESTGSSPGRRGFLMAVNEHGQTSGSIGGGIMEHKFIELAKKHFQQQKHEASLHQQVHSKSAPAHQSGMICSGRQTIALMTLFSHHLTTLKSTVECYESGGDGMLFLEPDRVTLFGSVTVIKEGLEIMDEANWKYTERIGKVPALIIVGGGHCALALSQLMSTLDFHITLVEEREALPTLQQNDFVHKKIVVNSYAELPQLLPHHQDLYIVVMTVGYRTDDVAVRALYSGNYKYLAVLGSTAKIETMMAAYLAEGFDADWLDRIKAPAGLPIKSQTPEEIAISIAAEIIQTKNGGRENRHFFLFIEMECWAFGR